MSGPARSVFDTRYDQMFPRLEPAELERLRRFGEARSYAAGAYLARTGEVSPGMFVILSGEVVVSQRDELAPHPPIVTYGPGSFMGELGQLSDRPAFVDGVAQSAVEAPIRHLFLLIGAEPNTAWLSQCDVALDDKGFVRTGADLGEGHRPLATSRAGVFAIGDVRAGSIKRVAAAVGEGAQFVAALHAFLAQVGDKPASTINAAQGGPHA